MWEIILKWFCNGVESIFVCVVVFIKVKGGNGKWMGCVVVFWLIMILM